jgi:hypothetical protein
VSTLALHMLARDGGRAEMAGNEPRWRAIEEALHSLVGHPLPDELCETWYRAAGHGDDS